MTDPSKDSIIRVDTDGVSRVSRSINPLVRRISDDLLSKVKRIQDTQERIQLPSSLVTPIVNDEVSRLAGLTEAAVACSEQDVIRNLSNEDAESESLEAVLATLSPRERDVLRLRYGLDDGRMKTHEEIGHIFDVPPERIRKIDAKVHRKLRPFLHFNDVHEE